MPHEINARQCGAIGDGQADDTAALQQALDSGARRVIIPPGIYRVARTLSVGSDTTVTADPSAVLRLADNAGTHAGVFLIANRNPGNGNANITVEGGVWDGNNEHNPRGQDGDLYGYTGTAINMVNVTGLSIRDLTVRNPEAFSVRVGDVRDFVIERILFDHAVIRPNQDGIHVGGYCERGVIRQLKADTPMTTNDDMVALNADDDVERVINLGMRRGPIRHIRVSDVSARDAYTFIRLLSHTAPLEHIAIENLRGACRVHMLNINNWRFPLGSGALRDIVCRDALVAKTACMTGGQNALIDMAITADEFAFDGLAIMPGHLDTAQTMIIRHGRPFIADFNGLSAAQVDGLRLASEGIALETGTAGIRVRGAPGAKLVLPHGPIPGLRHRLVT